MSDTESDNTCEEIQFKIIILGDESVGKTSIINRFCHQEFIQTYKKTIGVDFFSKKISLPNNIHVNLQFWDLSGQSIGGKMMR